MDNTPYPSFKNIRIFKFVLRFRVQFFSLVQTLSIELTNTVNVMNTFANGNSNAVVAGTS